MSDLPAGAYVGIGSSLRPRENLRAALAGLSNTPGLEVDGISTVYRTAPLPRPGPSPAPGPKEREPDFFNAVLALRTRVGPEGLQARFSELETLAGRQRTEDKFAPRTLDLDLLLYFRSGAGARIGPVEWYPIAPDGALVHRDVERRAFVALPLLELAPDLTLPPEGKPLALLAARFQGPGGLPELEFTTGLRAAFLRD